MEERKEIAKELMKMAKEKLESAKILLDYKKLHDAISRAYYAAYLSASAVLFLLGERPRTHDGLIYLFWLKLIKTGIVEKKYSRILSKLRNAREEGDYGPLFTIEEKEAKELFEEAKEFVARMENVFNKLLKQSNINKDVVNAN